MLLEALISIALLTAGLMACLETFSLVKQAMTTSARQSQMARCAQQKLLELAINLDGVQQGCEDITWSVERSPLSSHLEKIKLVGARVYAEGTYEETFETLRPT